MEQKSVFAAIIGGGTAGITCAVRIKERYPDRRVVLLERADRIGKKLLITGNGRCNLTNRSAAARCYHGDGSEELINILFEKYNPEAVLDFFRSLGLEVHTDGEGRVYPLSNSAGTVLEVLRLRLNELGAETLTGCTVTALTARTGGWQIRTDNGSIFAQNLIVATGGNADYKGADAGSFALLRMLSLATTKPTPALCPVKVESNVLKMLKGVRVAAEASLLDHGVELRRTRGEVQFTADALSGICIFDLARAVNRSEANEIILRLLPDLSREQIQSSLFERAAAFPDRTAEALMAGLFQKSVTLALLKTAGIHPNTPARELPKDALVTLAETIDGWRFDAVPRRDFKNAQVTAGGVRLSEIDPSTFGSKKHAHLTIIGEALDVDGDCGGYNLQFAFASGLCAGDSL